MAEVFFYTFRTNKYVAELEKALSQEVYVVDKPAKDFESLISEIEKSGAEVVCGIGMSKRYTRFERSVFNRVGKNKIDRQGPEQLDLDVPSDTTIRVDRRMTFGPCNYVTFRLKKELLNKKHYFLHLKHLDLENLESTEF